MLRRGIAQWTAHQQRPALFFKKHLLPQSRKLCCKLHSLPRSSVPSSCLYYRAVVEGLSIYDKLKIEQASGCKLSFPH